MENISRDLKEIVKRFAFEREVRINLKNFEEIELKDYFDFTDLYDLETLVEDHFFEGEDIIPDTQYTKIKDLINFIKIEAVMKEDDDSSSLTAE